jgi:hypothetical protein
LIKKPGDVFVYNEFDDKIVYVVVAANNDTDHYFYAIEAFRYSGQPIDRRVFHFVGEALHARIEPYINTHDMEYIDAITEAQKRADRLRNEREF